VTNPLVMIRRRRSAIFLVFIVCVAVAAATVLLQRRALTQQKAQADGRARTIASVVVGQLHGDKLAKPLDAATAARLQSHEPHEPVIAERVWTTTGTLRFSSLHKDASPPLMDLLKPATKGTGHVVSSYEGNVVTSYSPLRVGLGAPAYGAVEVQQSYPALVAAAAKPWTTIRTAAFALGLLMLLALLIGSVAALPGRRAAKAGAGFVPGSEDGEPSASGASGVSGSGVSEGPLRRGRPDPVKAPNAKAVAAATAASKGAEGANAEKARAEAAKKASDEEVAKLKEQLRSDHERAAARVEQLSGELERVKAQLKEAQVAATTAAAASAPVVDPAIAEHAHELEQSLATERHRSTAAEDRTAEIQAELGQTETRLRGSYAEIETLGAEIADLRANIERLTGELGAALERARGAEDLAAEQQDRLTAVEQAGNPLDVWAARQQSSPEPAADEEEGAADDLRSRLTRAAARKRGHTPGEGEWP
jgi:hypothetical protein